MEQDRVEYYRNDHECDDAECCCHTFGDTLRLSRGPLKPCGWCSCQWSDEPPNAGEDPYGRPDPSTRPEYWTE